MDSQENITGSALFFPFLLSRTQSSLRLELGQHPKSPEPSCFCLRPQPWGHRHLCITLAHTLGGCWGFKLRFSLSSDSPLQFSSRTLNYLKPLSQQMIPGTSEMHCPWSHLCSHFSSRPQDHLFPYLESLMPQGQPWLLVLHMRLCFPRN